MSDEQEVKNIGTAIKALSRKVHHALDKRIADTDVSGITGAQAMIIGYIAHNPERDIFQRDIESHFNIRRSTVTCILKLMEGNGLVERISVEHDGRLKKLVLTPKGQKIHCDIEQQLDLLENEMASALSPEELEQFFDFVARIGSVLE